MAYRQKKINPAEEFSFPGSNGPPYFNTVRNNYQFSPGLKQLDEYARQQQVNMAQQYDIAAESLEETAQYKLHFFIFKSRVFRLRKIQVIVCRILLPIHRKYLYGAAILQCQFTQRLTCHPAYFLYTAGGGEDAEGEEEDFGFDGWGLKVEGLWFMVCGLWFVVYGLWFRARSIKYLYDFYSVQKPRLVTNNH